MGLGFTDWDRKGILGMSGKVSLIANSQPGYGGLHC